MKMIIKIQKYVFNILISVDQFGNAIAGGDPDETISSTLGKLKRSEKGRIPWSRPLARILDMILDKIDANHSINAIEEDEGKNSVRKTFPRRRGPR